MGNAPPPRMRHEDTATAGRRSRNADAEAPASCWRGGGAVRRRRRGVEEEEERRRAGGGGAVVGSTVVMTVKVVMKRKHAEKLIAWLDEQSARQRKARMAELRGWFRTRDDGGGRSP